MKGRWIRGSIGVGALCYIAIVLLLKSTWQSSTYVYFSFTLFAFLLVFADTFRGAGDVIFRMISSAITHIYFLIQFIIGGILGVCFSPFNFIHSIVLELIVTAVYFIVYLAFTHIERTTWKTRSRESMAVNESRMFKTRLELLKDNVQGQQYQELVEIIEDLDSSYPIHPNSVEPLDDKINQAINDLENSISKCDTDKTSVILASLHELIDESRLKSVIKPHA